MRYCRSLCLWLFALQYRVNVVHRRIGLNIATSHSNDDLAPFGIVPDNWEWAIPASPVVLRVCGAMVIN
eukprot:6735169-Pyramimonas_sp.AAC.1